MGAVYSQSLKAVNDELLTKSELGVGQTWQNVTISRESGVTYTNTTGKSILLVINTKDSRGPAYICTSTVNVDGVLVRSDDMRFSNNTVLVPNGSTYSLQAEAVYDTVRSWLELR